jgi:hypothetical protein
MEAIGLECSLLYDRGRSQEVWLVVQAVAVAVRPPNTSQLRAEEVGEECGGDGEEAPGLARPKAGQL